MRSDLRLAFRRQKKVLLLFLLSVLLPALILGFFGLRALEADRYRTEERLKREQGEVLRLFLAGLESRIQKIENHLEATLAASRLQQKEGRWAELQELVSRKVKRGQLLGETLFWKPGGEFFFANRGYLITEDSSFHLEESKPAEFLRAEELEFREGRKQEAARLYGALASSPDPRVRILAFSALGRSYYQVRDYDRSEEAYRKLVEPWPSYLDSSLAVYPLMASLQVASCLEMKGKTEESLAVLYDLYAKMLKDLRIVSSEVVRFYAAEAEKKIDVYCTQQPSSLCLRYQALKAQKEDRMVRLVELERLRHHVLPLVESWRQLGSLERRQVFRVPPLGGVLVVVPAEDWRGRSSESAFLASFLDKETLLEQIGKPVLNSLGISPYVRFHIEPEQEDAPVLFRTRTGDLQLPYLRFALPEPLPPWTISVDHDASEFSLSSFALENGFYLIVTAVLGCLLIFGTFLTAGAVFQEMERISLKSDFVSLVSHELKSPITSMRTLMERLQAGLVEDPQKRQQYFDVLCGELQRLTRLVNNVLDFSKMESGKKKYLFVETDLGQLLRDLLTTFEPRAIQKGFLIVSEIPEDLPPVRVDRDSIYQAVLNLLDNAVKFAVDEKFIRLQVSLADNMVIISVEDRGPGIREEERERIFEQAYRSRESEYRDVPGVGLGLSIVAHVVKAHGGTVSVQSGPGQGTRFSLKIPFRSDGARVVRIPLPGRSGEAA